MNPRTHAGGEGEGDAGGGAEMKEDHRHAEEQTTTHKNKEKADKSKEKKRERHAKDERLQRNNKAAKIRGRGGVFWASDKRREGLRADIDTVADGKAVST